MADRRRPPAAGPHASGDRAARPAAAAWGRKRQASLLVSGRPSHPSDPTRPGPRGGPSCRPRPHHPPTHTAGRQGCLTLNSLTSRGLPPGRGGGLGEQCVRAQAFARPGPGVQSLPAAASGPPGPGHGSVHLQPLTPAKEGKWPAASGREPVKCAAKMRTTQPQLSADSDTIIH